MKHTYRIEIPSRDERADYFFFWIGANLELVSKLEDAIPCTEEESLSVMERIDCPASCYREAA